ncbi:hypothetical protein TNCV_4154051 [Trichonephila clavipes]|nr:hypothetical protein TNCV_4154051 [Trichonephila clavipes]
MGGQKFGPPFPRAVRGMKKDVDIMGFSVSHDIASGDESSHSAPRQTPRSKPVILTSAWNYLESTNYEKEGGLRTKKPRSQREDGGNRTSQRKTA